MTKQSTSLMQFKEYFQTIFPIDLNVFLMCFLETSPTRKSGLCSGWSGMSPGFSRRYLFLIREFLSAVFYYYIWEKVGSMNC